MELDSEIGNFVITSPDGSEIYIHPPETFDYYFDDEILESLFLSIKDTLGQYENIENFSHEEDQGPGVYTLDAKSYLSTNYKLDIINDEFSCGASGGTEQIILAIIAGVSGGIAGEIAKLIFKSIINKAKKEYGKEVPDKSTEETNHLIEKTLIKRFNATEPVYFKTTKYINGKTEITITDSKNNSYVASYQNKEGSILLEIKSLTISSIGTDNP